MTTRLSLAYLMGEVHAMSSGIQCPRSCAGYSAAAGMLAAGRDGAVDCEAVVVPHAQSDQAVASSQMACLRFVRRRSEERRGGKACVRTCRYRWLTDPSKNTNSYTDNT